MPLHIKYEHTPELSYDFAKHYWKSKKSLKIIFGLLIAVLLVQLLNTFINDGADLKSTLTVLLPVGMILIIWLWLIPVTMRKQIERADQQSKLGRQREFIFGEEELLIRTGQSESTFAYEGLLHYNQSEMSYFLYIGTNQAMILPKSALAPGEAEELHAILNEKGVPYIGK